MEIITTECRTEFAVCNEVSTTYENTRSQIDDVTMKVEIRQNRLQETVLRSQKFEESLDDFLDTLSKLEERMEKEKPVSGKLELVKQQKDEHAQIHNDVMQLEPVFEQIIKAAENLIETSEAGDELEKFKQQVEETKQRYKSVQQTSLKRHKKINNGVLFTQKFYDEITPIEKWLNEKEEGIVSVKEVPCFESTISCELKDVKDMLDSFEEKKPCMENVAALCASVVENADTDHFDVEEKKKTVDEKYKSLNGILTDRESKLSTLLPLAKTYSKEKETVKEYVHKVDEYLLNSCPTYGIDEDKVRKDEDYVSELMERSDQTATAMDALIDTGKKITEEIKNQPSSELVTLNKTIEELADRNKVNITVWYHHHFLTNETAVTRI